MAVNNEFPITFAEDGSVVVNFGILSGREATKLSWIGLLWLFARQALVQR